MHWEMLSSAVSEVLAHLFFEGGFQLAAAQPAPKAASDSHGFAPTLACITHTTAVMSQSKVLPFRVQLPAACGSQVVAGVPVILGPPPIRS
jgi:hypothetical protein